MSTSPRKILVIRNDKLGDFMLAWPALSLLKQQYPEARISVLIPSYTSPVAEACPWIDDIIIDDQRHSTFADAKYLAGIIKQHNFDASITLFSEFRVGLALWLARIPLRIAPATKIVQVLYNRTLAQRRSRSEKPEYIYNVDLVRYFIHSNGDEPLNLQSAPFLSFDSNEIQALKTDFMTQHAIEVGKQLVFIHPGSGGSANNLSLDQFAELAKVISNNSDLHCVITAGPGEIDIAKKLSELLGDTSHSLYHSTEGLIKFSKHIAFCSMFVSGSTGPLHIAGALNVFTTAFYPTRRSATSLRWQTLNQDEKRLAYSPDKIEQNSDLSSINATECANDIVARLS